MPADAAAGSADEFWASFNSKIELLQSDVVGAEQLSDMVVLRDKFVEIQAFATDSALVLANYDLKRAQEVLETTSKYIKEKEIEVQPKKKFFFKSKQQVFERMRSEAEGKKAKSSNQQQQQAKSEEATTTNYDTLYIVNGKEGERIVLTTEMIGVANGVMRSLLIRNCKSTTLFARCVLGAVRVEDCEDCRIFLGPCSTSVYLDSIVRGSVFICCHQLRIHKSRDVQLYVRVNGHPIIEDCAGMGFAPYQVSYPRFGDDLKSTGLEDAQCWDNVIDFRWHRSTQSPNWHVILPEQRTEVESGPDDNTEWGAINSDNTTDGHDNTTGRGDGGVNDNPGLPPRPPPDADARVSLSRPVPAPVSVPMPVEAEAEEDEDDEI